MALGRVQGYLLAHFFALIENIDEQKRGGRWKAKSVGKKRSQITPEVGFQNARKKVSGSELFFYQLLCHF